MGLADTANLVVKLSLEGNLNTELSRAEASLNRFGASVGKVGSKIGSDLGRGIRTSAQNLERLAFVAGGLAIGAGAAAVHWAGDFQAQLNTINTIAFATPDALNAIGDSIRKIAKDTGIATDDLTSAYYDLLSAGVKTADAQSLLNNAVTLGIGGLATTQQTVDLLTTAYNAYHLSAAGATIATDQFAQAVADGKVKADQIAASFSDVASIAKTYNVGIDQIATSYAFLTAQGVAATEVTTEMQRAIISLIKPLPALDAAQKALKVNFTDEIRNKGLVPALQELRIYADKNKIPLIELLGRVEAVKYALQTTGPNFTGFLDEQKRILASSGEAAKQAAERQKGFNFELARLKANVKDAGITIGTYLLPPLADLSKELSDFLAGHQNEIKQFANDLGVGIRDAVKWAKSLDWNGIGAGLKTAATFAKSIVDTFSHLPTEAKETLLALYALNKLSGGAAVNIGVDLLKGVGGQFFARGSSPANPMFVSGGGLGAGGAGGGLLNLVQKVFLVGILASVADDIQGALGSKYDPAKNLPLDQLSWPFGPKNTPKVDFGPWTNIFGGDSSSTPSPDAHIPGGAGGGFTAATPIGRNPDHMIVTAPDLTADMRENNRILRQTGQVEAAGLSRIASAIARFGYTPAQWAAIYERAAKAGGSSQINALARTHKSLDAIALADSETSKFLTGKAGPFFQDGKNQTRLLASLESRQKYFQAHGDTVTAAALGRNIAALKNKPNIVNVTVPVNMYVTVRDYVRQQTIASHYGTTFGGRVVSKNGTYS